MPLERVYLLADMHLKPRDDRDAERLARFLAHIVGKADTLVLLGDTFNFWLERKGRFIGDYAAALSLFKEASEKGLAIHHVSGNRDFVVGEGLGFDPLTRYPGFIRYRNGFTVSRLVDFGIEVHGPRFRFHQAGKTVACLHGDALCTGDLPFMLLRWGLQGPVGRTFFKYAPWALLKQIVARQQARTRIRAVDKKQRPASLLNPNAVRQEMAMGADILVCGHLHRAHESSLTVAERERSLVVLPAWIDGAFGIIENGEVRIETFREETR